MRFKKTIITTLVALAVTGCTLTDNQKLAIGAGAGGLVGGVVGHQVNDKSGVYVGAVLGALAGGGISYYMNQQQKDLEKILSSSGISVKRINESTIKLNLPESITFATNKSNLNAAVLPSLSRIAGIINKYPKTAIHVLGFTDSTGAESYNMGLSERRATSVANFLSRQGVVSGRLAVLGYGENYPIASNNTVLGKAKNRRAEIYIRAIEKGNEQAAYSPIY